jgi:hypothetical protein
MDLKLKVEINSKRPDQISKLCELIREGWEIGRIEKEAEKDQANNDMLFVLIRE